MPNYRSRTTTHGRNMSGARALWRATGVKEQDFGKPIIAIANSFTQFVPGHVHLKDLGQMVAREIEKQGAIAKEFHTIAVDDGIAMGHGGMLYSLPSREIIADSVEYMVNAHCADALLCISNCDKITPGMLMAALRLNIPTIFVSGGPMEAGKIIKDGKEIKVDLVAPMIAAGDDAVSDEELKEFEQNACPTCGSCSGMFTANSMNCLVEALGLALPGNGTLLATHARRRELFLQAARVLVANVFRYYEKDDASVLPRNIATHEAFQNAMTLDIAMGGSTNTILHLLAAAVEAEVDFDLSDIDKLSRRIPNLCKVAPSVANYHVEDVHRAGGIMAILAELKRADLLHDKTSCVHAPTIGQAIDHYDVFTTDDEEIKKFYQAAPGGVPTQTAFSQDSYYESLDLDRKQGCVRSYQNAYAKEGGLAVLYGNLAEDGCVVKTAGVDPALWHFEGRAKVFESQDEAVAAILTGKIVAGDVVVIRYEGPCGGPGMQEMLYPTSYLKSKHLDKDCALITDGRFSGGTSGLSIGHISPEAAHGGLIALIEEGDTIVIDIPSRSLVLAVEAEVVEKRRSKLEQRALDNGQKNIYTPVKRKRTVTQALKAYALLASSADKGGVRSLDFVARSDNGLKQAKKYQKKAKI